MLMFFEKLKILKENRLFREIKDRASPQGSKIKLGGREYVNFSSNDYLGLANHPYIINEVKKALDEYGSGSGASRLLSGGSILHKELEDKTAQFKETESALVFNSGYAANSGIIPAITDKDDMIFSDELNHASIIDGCRLSKAKTVIYRHKDLSHLEDLIRKEDAKNKIVITDTVFSMDGDIAPLAGIYDICKKNNAILYIDDAHGTGVLGNGRGTLSHFNIKPEPWVIQMGTFSKALGSFGAFVTGNREVIEWIQNTARSFIFSTALPSCVIAASIAALELIKNDSELIKKLWENRDRAASDIKDSGYDIMGSETPIIPLKTGNVEDTLRISRHLYEKGLFAPAIRPPTVIEPKIRITVTASHTDEDIEKLIEALKKVN
ncbi:MAG: 8-amino-7-oxononanoate synthase [Thermodesulfovibrio sp. RBG_19FT_COMBO_41_18]|nr:MAG: 8-amino-7-oxononanoate synthase [Thermodesulfovibrio sp. RBG_19FT_COMBO_41_18]